MGITLTRDEYEQFEIESIPTLHRTTPEGKITHEHTKRKIDVPEFRQENYPKNTAGVASELRKRGFNMKYRRLNQLIEFEKIPKPSVLGRNLLWYPKIIDAVIEYLINSPNEKDIYTWEAQFCQMFNLDLFGYKMALLRAGCTPYAPTLEAAEISMYRVEITPGFVGANIPGSISFVGPDETFIKQSREATREYQEKQKESEKW